MDTSIVCSAILDAPQALTIQRGILLSGTSQAPHHGSFKRCCPIKAREHMGIIVHKSTMPGGRREPMELTAAAHANAILSHIRNPNCSGKQNRSLIDAVVKSIKNP